MEEGAGSRVAELASDFAVGQVSRNSSTLALE